MTRYLAGLVLALALGVMGCSETAGTGGGGGQGGVGGSGGQGGGTFACADNVCPCTEAGIRAAIAEGGGPFTFDCDGPTKVITEAEISIANDVILDGEGNLTVDGGHRHGVFSVGGAITATLEGITVTRGFTLDNGGGGILNYGTLTLRRCTVSDNFADLTRFSNTFRGGGGIYNFGTLRIIDSTLSENGTNRGSGAGIHNHGVNDHFPGNLAIINSTISGNIVDEGQGGGIYSQTIFEGANVTLSYSTVADNAARDGAAIAGFGIPIIVTRSIVKGDCEGDLASDGYNMESPGDTCGFGEPSDLAGVPQLWLSVLKDNGGPTKTHQLIRPSVAIDVIPQADCVDADGAPLTEDQRGEPRPGGTMCDAGAFEVQP